MIDHIPIVPQPDGTFIRWGRAARFNGQTEGGPTVVYEGEAAEVIALFLPYGSGGQ